MAKKKYQIVLSDFHLGAGAFLPDGTRNYLEDFFYDKKFAELVDYYCNGDYVKAEVELVIAGDFFNLLQVFPDELQPQFINESVAVSRIKAILAGHPVIFSAIKVFLEHSKRKVTFLIGNHDAGLFFKGVQGFLKDSLGENVFIHEKPEYVTDGVWIEHGNQYTIDNVLNFDEPFINGDEQILKLTWGDMFVIRFLNRVKRERPYIDKLHPFKHYLRWAIIHDTKFAFKVLFKVLGYFLEHLLGLGEFRKFRFDKAFKFAHKLKLRAPLDKSAARVFDENENTRIVIFGHCHVAVARQFFGGREYFNTGVWNELISLDAANLGRSLRLTFVEVEFAKERPYAKLKQWHGLHQVVEEI